MCVRAEGNPTPYTRSILVRGPLDDILATLKAQTTASNKDLVAENTRLRTLAVEFAERFEELGDELERLRSTLAHTQTLELYEKWLDVPAMGIPTLYSSTHVRANALMSRSEGRALFVARFFAAGVDQWDGSYKQTLTYGHTNLRDGGRVPSGQGFHVFGVKVELIDCSDAFATFLRTHMLLKWDFSQTSVDIAALGGFDWAPDGRSGYLRLGLGEPQASAPPRDSVAEPTRELSTPSAPTDIPSIPRPFPSNLFKITRTGVFFPGSAKFGVLGVVQGPPTPDLIDETASVRVSLAGYYLSDIEIG